MPGFEMLLDQSPLNSVQRGVAAAAGNIVINAVDPEKTVVISRSKGSAGTVATNSTIPAHYISGMTPTNTGGNTVWYFDSSRNYSQLRAEAVTLTGGTTDLYVKEYSAKLVDSTHIYVDGPCEWQVIESV